MNKTLKKAIAVVTLALASSIAVAQEPKTLPNIPNQAPGVVALPLVMPCNRSQKIFDLLQGEKYKESPIALGEANVFRPDNMPVKGQLSIWYSTEGNKNFSVVFTIANSDISCIITSGVGMELIPIEFGTPL
jgi:hypothetical protein